MKEIIQLLYEASDKKECYYDYPAIFMSIGKFQVILSFDSEEGFGDGFIFIEDIEPLKEFVESLTLKEFKINIIEYLGYREDGGKWNEEEELFYFRERPNSLANATIQLAKELTAIKSTLVKSYDFIIDDPSQGYCGGEPNYVGEVLINTEQIKLTIVKRIVIAINNVKIQELGVIYCPSYYKDNRPKNNFSPQFLNTNTKVRRLGYLKLFFKYINEKKKVPQIFIDKKFEEFSLQFSSQLNDLSNNKGVIQNLHGKSAEPYISLLKEMDLITTVNKVVVPTKWLKTYLALIDKFTDGNSEVFILDKIDKIFLMEVILKKDYLYSIVILEFLFVTETCTTQEVINNFQKLLLKRIESLLSQTKYKDVKAISQLKEIEKRVMAWQKAEVYLEHIIMPRVNWYADLSLVTLSDNIVTINENGKRLLSELNSWIDIKAEYVADSVDFLKKFYPHIYAKSYFGSYGEYPSKEIIHGLVEEYINESFILFKTLAPNRVTSSQAFTFAKYCFYLKNGLSVSESYLTEIVEKIFSKKYIYKYQPRYGDGYIQKI